MIFDWLIWLSAVLAVAFVVIPLIINRVEASAYNAGFKFGQEWPDLVFFSWKGLKHRCIFPFQKKAFMQGYRHGRGY